MQTKLHTSPQAGVSLIEMLIYIAILIVILVALIDIVFSFAKSYEQLGALRAAEHSGIVGLERMVRDIHNAAAVTTAQSGVLIITNATTTTRFYVDNGTLKVDVNGAYIGPLSVPQATITSLIFHQITTTNTQAVKIDMAVQGTQGAAVKVKNFHTTAILKRS